MTDLGGFSFQTFSARSHGWADAMNRNLLKMATLLQPAVLSRQATLPSSADPNNCYIDPETNLICVWQHDQWNFISPSEGALVYVADEEVYCHFKPDHGWLVAIDLNDVPAPVPRTLAFFAPGRVRPAATLFHYVCGQEFTLRPEAPGSSATLETAPIGGDVVISITGGVGEASTVTFTDGMTEGVFSVPEERIWLPSEADGAFVNPHEMRITSPADVYGMQGLAITLRGVVRSPVEG